MIPRLNAAVVLALTLACSATQAAQLVGFVMPADGSVDFEGVCRK